jgi:hypothetical protein
VRAAFALDSDHQRFAIVHSLRELVRAGGEQAVGRPLEEQERRTRLELSILLQQVVVALLELRQMFFFLFSELLEHAAPTRVACHPRGA